jgi:hypothetical protein
VITGWRRLGRGGGDRKSGEEEAERVVGKESTDCKDGEEGKVKGVRIGIRI